MNWIPVSERLPEDRQTVLVWAGNLGTEIYGHRGERVRLFLVTSRQGKTRAELPNGPWSSYDQWSNNLLPYDWESPGMNLYGQDVTHWMPVPSNPS